MNRMKSNGPTQKGRRRKFLLLLPLFILPFVTMLFWAMGGGSTNRSGVISKKGFNLQLPSAQFKEDKAMDKLNYYDKAALDSTKLEELRKKDPNYRFASVDSAGAVKVAGNGLRMDSYKDPQEEKVYQRLAVLQRTISQPAPTPATASGQARTATAPLTSGYEADLKQMLQSMDSPAQPDPEMEQISGMLENILNLQYPERMEQKLREESTKNRGQIYGVALEQEQEIIGSLGNPGNAIAGSFGASARHTGFYGLDAPAPTSPDNAVQALIAENQTVVNGATVKMSLAQDIYVNGNKVPKNTYVYGTASLKGERLAIEITTIRHGNSIYPVELAVFDLDGLQGIYIPGAINRDVAKASADRSMQALGVTTLSDSWGAQAAGAGMEAAKGLFSRKVKLVKVTLKGGYIVLLKDEKQKDN
jgi:conjugative transposon TraM protein